MYEVVNFNSVDRHFDNPDNEEGGNGGIFRSTNIDDASKTPYSDATQVCLKYSVARKDSIFLIKNG